MGLRSFNYHVGLQSYHKQKRIKMVLYEMFYTDLDNTGRLGQFIENICFFSWFFIHSVIYSLIYDAFLIGLVENQTWTDYS